jgi:hypothetical protein
MNCKNAGKMKPTFSTLAAMIAVIGFVLRGVAGAEVTNLTPTEVVLVPATAVSQQAITSWKKEGFRALRLC